MTDILDTPEEGQIEMVYLGTATANDGKSRALWIMADEFESLEPVAYNGRAVRLPLQGGGMTYWRPGRGGPSRRQRSRRDRYEYSAEQPPAPPAAGPRGCSRRQEGDEYVCHCGVRWDMREDRPACPHNGGY